MPVILSRILAVILKKLGRIFGIDPKTLGRILAVILKCCIMLVLSVLCPTRVLLGITHIEGEPLKKNVQKRDQMVHLTNGFLMITLVKCIQ